MKVLHSPDYTLGTLNARNHKRKGLFLHVTTVRFGAGVWEAFQKRALEAGFIHFIDALQLLLKAYADTGMPRLIATPRTRTRKGPAKHAETLKIRTDIFERFVARAKPDKRFEDITDCIVELVARFADGRIQLKAIQFID